MKNSCSFLSRQLYGLGIGLTTLTIFGVLTNCKWKKITWAWREDQIPLNSFIVNYSRNSQNNILFSSRFKSPEIHRTTLDHETWVTWSKLWMLFSLSSTSLYLHLEIILGSYHQFQSCDCSVVSFCLSLSKEKRDNSYSRWMRVVE